MITVAIGTIGATAEQGVCLLPNRDSHLEAMSKVLTLLYKVLRP